MATTEAQGTLLKLDVATVLTTVAQRVTVKPPGAEVADIATTDLDSEWHSSRPGIPKPKPVTMRLHYDPANTTHTALWTALTTRSIETWQVVYADPGAMEVDFDGYVKDWDEAEAEVDGLLAVDVTIQPTGPITRTMPA